MMDECRLHIAINFGIGGAWGNGLVRFACWLANGGGLRMMIVGAINIGMGLWCVGRWI